MRHDTNPARVHQLSVHNGQIGTLEEHAQRTIAAVVHDAPEPVRFTCVRLTRHGDPATHLVVAQAIVELNERTLEVLATAPTPGEAIDRLAEKLRHRLAGEGPGRSGSLGSRPAGQQWCLIGV